MMEQIPENKPEQVNSESAMPPPSLGSMLRAARNQHGMSVADVAAQTKFAPRQIKALEADDFRSLPETAFLRGFVRSYAKILNLDAGTLLGALPIAKSPTPELGLTSVNVPFPIDNSEQKNRILLIAALLMAVVVAGFAVWHFTSPVKHASVVKTETPVSLPAEAQLLSPPAPQQPEISAESKHRSTVKMDLPETEKPAPVPVITPTQSADSANHKNTAIKTSAANGTVATTPVRAVITGKLSKLHLVFDEKSWTAITDGNGKMISSQINPPGSELNIEGQLPLSVVIGHATATHLYQDGKPVDLVPHTNSSSEVARLTLE